MKKQQQQKDRLSVLDRLSFDDLKKTDSVKQCHFKDFQPFLEYSPWHFFELVVEKCIQGCKKSLHFLEHPIGETHTLTSMAELEDWFPEMFSKRALIAVCQMKMPRVKTLKENEDSSMHELFAHRRHYSSFSKE